MSPIVKNRQRIAAVVLLIRGSQTPSPELLLVKRARHLNSHAGEVGLPGGMAEAVDKDLWHTALREAEEEVGLSPNTVILQQSMPHAFTRQGVEVAPFVAIWQQEHPLRLCADEIEAAFWLPLPFLMQDKRVRTDIFTRQEQEYWAPVYHFAGQIIWGFTARLLVEYVNTCHNTSIGRHHRAPVTHYQPT